MGKVIANKSDAVNIIEYDVNLTDQVVYILMSKTNDGWFLFRKVMYETEWWVPTSLGKVAGTDMTQMIEYFDTKEEAVMAILGAYPDADIFVYSGEGYTPPVTLVGDLDSWEENPKFTRITKKGTVLKGMSTG